MEVFIVRRGLKFLRDAIIISIIVTFSSWCHTSSTKVNLQKSNTKLQLDVV